MKQYQICKHCIMDTSDPNITFNQDSICTHCEKLIPLYEVNAARTQNEIENDLKNAATRIKKLAKGAKYDCVMGMSGGVDSSFVVDLLVDKMGLKPLIVHFDNGWNTEVSNANIQKIVKKYDLSVLTHTMDWPEFKDLQRAFFYAGVLDIEMVTDNAIYATLIKMAKANGIKCIVSGENFATESGIPKAWRWEKIDGKNIKAIHSRFGKTKLRDFPIYGPWKLIFDRIFSGIHFFYPLNIIQYKKKEAIETLQHKFDWQYYGGKHYESTFTKFYQAYILPTKFGVDKRRAHLSSLIRNKELTRDEALLEVTKPLYEPLALKEDLTTVLKKLEFSEEEFNHLMAKTPEKHDHYPTDEMFLMKIKSIANLLKVKKGAFI